MALFRKRKYLSEMRKLCDKILSQAGFGTHALLLSEGSFVAMTKDQLRMFFFLAKRHLLAQVPERSWVDPEEKLHAGLCLLPFLTSVVKKGVSPFFSVRLSLRAGVLSCLGCHDKVP